MNFSEYINKALTTAKSFPTLSQNIEHAAWGILTESGEIASTLKKLAIYGRALDDSLSKNLREEIGDLYWYVALLAHYVGWRPDFPQVKIDLPPERAYVPVAHSLAVASAKAWDYAVTLDGRLPREVIDQLMNTAGALSQALGFDLQELLQENLEKLGGAKGRYGASGYSDAAAQARADKVGEEE